MRVARVGVAGSGRASLTLIRLHMGVGSSGGDILLWWVMMGSQAASPEAVKALVCATVAQFYVHIYVHSSYVRPFGYSYAAEALFLYLKTTFICIETHCRARYTNCSGTPPSGAVWGPRHLSVNKRVHSANNPHTFDLFPHIL